MCKYLLCKYLAKLNAFLVEAVNIPKEALEHYLVLEVCKNGPQCFGCKLLSDDDAGRTVSFKI